MSDAPVAFVTNRATAEEIAAHLHKCDVDFVPALSGRVHIAAYARKLVASATRIEVWSGETFVALAAVYCNDRHTNRAYLSSLSVLPAWRGLGLASRLLAHSLAAARQTGMETMALEVGGANTTAIALYQQAGFRPDQRAGDFLTMSLQLPKAT